MMPLDCVRFVIRILVEKFDLVVLNPSLGRTALARDAVFLRIAKALGKRVVVFVHGWDPAVKRQIDERPRRFVGRYAPADAFIVLAAEFRSALREWGVSAPIFLSTTKVEDGLIDGFDVGCKTYGKTVLFLARVETDKGILTAIDAFGRISDSHPEAKLIVAGDGGAMSDALSLVSQKGIPRVTFVGHVSVGDVGRLFRASDIYILPTEHEGMPTSVLEAMAFGLPVVTRSVGGLRDILKDGEMGAVSLERDPAWFASAMERLLSDPMLLAQIGLRNHAFAKSRFLASTVSAQLEEIFTDVIRSTPN